ncbi:ankyrin repeat domain-containing protein [Parashewanella tropica]|uniref:ankyrin repeat domain-containing protein n=1 Tax=Parashewanella tropica TaxID=2547970 RepID=UPI001059799B|nr:ankyrin repeat domain-containing protein [Parashewanella tropica]
MSAETQPIGLKLFTQDQPHASVCVINERGEETQLELQIYEVGVTGFTRCKHTWTVKEITQNARLAKQANGLPLNIRFFHHQELFAITDARLTYSDTRGWKIVRGFNTPIRQYLQHISVISPKAKETLTELEETLNGTHRKQRQLIELVVSITEPEDPRCQQLSLLLKEGVNLSIGKLGPANPLTATFLGFFSASQKSTLENPNFRDCPEHKSCILYSGLEPLCDTLLKSGKLGVVDIAIVTGKTISLEIMLEQDIDLDSVNFGIAFRLNLKGPNNLEEIIEQLIEHGLPLQTVIEDSLPLLHWACSRQLLPIVHSLVENHQYDVNYPSALGVTPIMSAFGALSIDAINLLLQKGADVDAVSEQLEGDTALHLLARLKPDSWDGDVTKIFVKLISEKPERLVVLNNDKESPLSIMIEQDNLEPLMGSKMRKACNTLLLPQETLSALLHKAIVENNIDLFEILLSFNPEIKSDEYQKNSLLDTILQSASSDIVGLTMKYLREKNQFLAREYHGRVVAILTDENQPQYYATWVKCFKFTDDDFVRINPKIRVQLENLYRRLITSWQTNHLNQLVQLANERYVDIPVDFTGLLNQCIEYMTTDRMHIDWYHIEALVNHIESQSLTKCNLEALLCKMLVDLQKQLTSTELIYINQQTALRSISTLLTIILNEHHGVLPAEVGGQLTDFIKASYSASDLPLAILEQCPLCLNKQQLLFQELAMHAVSQQKPKLFITLLNLLEDCQIDLTAVLETKMTKRENVIQRLHSLNQNTHKWDIAEIDVLVTQILIRKDARLASALYPSVVPQKIIVKQNTSAQVEDEKWQLVKVLHKDLDSDSEQ